MIGYEPGRRAIQFRDTHSWSSNASRRFSNASRHFSNTRVLDYGRISAKNATRQGSHVFDGRVPLYWLLSFLSSAKKANWVHIIFEPWYNNQNQPAQINPCELEPRSTANNSYSILPFCKKILDFWHRHKILTLDWHFSTMNVWELNFRLLAAPFAKASPSKKRAYESRFQSKGQILLRIKFSIFA